jgi:hypothetical protein
MKIKVIMDMLRPGFEPGTLGYLHSSERPRYLTGLYYRSIKK